MRAAASWIYHSRPGICSILNRDYQITEEKFSLNHVKCLNKTIIKLKRTSSTTLKYKMLDIDSIHLRVYTGASFASTEDNSSHVGYIILLTDNYDACHVLAYSSNNSKRVVRSILAGEIFLFKTAFDHAFVLHHDIGRIIGKSIRIAMFTDSEQLFNLITIASNATDKRLIVEITAAKEAHNRYETSNSG